jgi:hypothetical protein
MLERQFGYMLGATAAAICNANAFCGWLEDWQTDCLAVTFAEVMAIGTGIVRDHCCDIIGDEGADLVVWSEPNMLLSGGSFVDAALESIADAVGEIVSTLQQGQMLLDDAMAGIDGYALLVVSVGFGGFRGFVFGAANVAIEKSALLLFEEIQDVPDMFLGLGFRAAAVLFGRGGASELVSWRVR